MLFKRLLVFLLVALLLIVAGSATLAQDDTPAKPEPARPVLDTEPATPEQLEKFYWLVSHTLVRLYDAFRELGVFVSPLADNPVFLTSPLPDTASDRLISPFEPLLWPDTANPLPFFRPENLH